MTPKLFSSFPSANKASWEELAKKDLKGLDPNKALRTTYPQGLYTLPFYTKEDLSGLDTSPHAFHPPNEIEGLSARVWNNAVCIAVANIKEANQEILKVLNQGADALVLELEGNEELDALLKGVLIPYVELWIKPKNHPRLAWKTFSEWVKKQDVDKVQLKGGLLWDSLSRKEYDVEISRELVDIFRMGNSLPNFKSLSVSELSMDDASYDPVTQLALVFSKLIEVVDELTEQGFTPEEVLSGLFIHMQVGNRYFLEMAKIKAARMGLHRIAQGYGLDLKPEQFRLFVETQPKPDSDGEVHDNMIRNTVQTMAALLGGANSVLVHPHDQNPDVFSKRMARNIPCILKEESHLDKVIDPMAGSYYLDHLTVSMLDLAWEQLIRMEDEGGWKALENGKYAAKTGGGKA